MQSCVCRICSSQCLSALLTIPCRNAAVSAYYWVTHLCKVCKALPAGPSAPAGVCSMLGQQGRERRLVQSLKSSQRRAGAKQFQAVQCLLDACEPESFCSFLESFWLGCVSWLVAETALSTSACPPQPHACIPWTREGCDKNKSRKRSSLWQLSAPHLITEMLFAFLT